jgi:hypothetical protein
LYVMGCCMLWDNVRYMMLYVIGCCTLYAVVRYWMLYVIGCCMLWDNVRYELLNVMGCCTLWVVINSNMTSLISYINNASNTCWYLLFSYLINCGHKSRVISYVYTERRYIYIKLPFKCSFCFFTFIFSGKQY